MSRHYVVCGGPPGDQRFRDQLKELGGRWAVYTHYWDVSKLMGFTLYIQFAKDDPTELPWQQCPLPKYRSFALEGELDLDTGHIKPCGCIAVSVEAEHSVSAEMIKELVTRANLDAAKFEKGLKHEGHKRGFEPPIARRRGVRRG